MNWSFSIGRMFGVRVRVHLTFLAFLLWVAIAFWREGGANAMVSGLVSILLLFVCVVLHEFGHILVGRRYGAQTQDVVLLPIGGIARMKSIPEKPGQELAVALAGPGVNFGIAAILMIPFGPAVLAATVPGPGSAEQLAGQLIVANLVLALFNLLPAFPMDGGRALRALLAYRMSRARATMIATKVGHVLAIGLGIAGFIAGHPLIMLVALFIFFAATAENNDTQLHHLARHLMVSDATVFQYSKLPVTATIDDAVSLLIHTTQHDIPIVDGVGKAIGMLTRNEVLRAIQEQPDGGVIADYVRTNIPTVQAQNELEQALRVMEQGTFPAIAVTDQHGHLVGMITLENLGQMLLLGRAKPERPA